MRSAPHFVVFSPLFFAMLLAVDGGSDVKAGSSAVVLPTTRIEGTPPRPTYERPPRVPVVGSPIVERARARPLPWRKDFRARVIASVGAL